MSDLSWMKIPASRMVQVSYRKWRRLKTQVNWKLIKDVAEERKAWKLEKERLERTADNAFKALERAQDMTIKWMDKYEEVLKRYHGEFK